MTATERALLAFASTSPKITSGGISPELQALLDAGFMEPAPYDKAGLMGDGWQITTAGRIALLNPKGQEPCIDICDEAVPFEQERK